MDETTIAGRYRLGEVLGRGGMGTVRRAHDERLGRDVAIKTVDLSEAHDATVGDRFTREAQVTASLAHPNIVTVHDFGVEGETGYLVMELLSDPTLADLLRERGTLTVPQAADVARQVAEALAAAHARGVVHRDVKPSNIVVGPTGRVCVLDFGITRIVDEATSTQLTAAQEGRRGQRDQPGRGLRYAGVAFDVSVQRATQHALAAKSQELETVVGTTPAQYVAACAAAREELAAAA